ncbi:hypothetical protein MWU53_08795 [Aliiroseovarius sp. S1123]|uniref:hypothetical protein n=1 Tax=unclassified Aliiroseovarius TaxID=2623558 RepID=UPI001FF147FF|nr:hypothetical protein [Aliiroseovarius sp. S1123]MCK0171153.1 hypothetical protein [Aliiroseovarius sp. S1123]
MLEFEVTVSVDGNLFRNTVYTDLQSIRENITNLAALLNNNRTHSDTSFGGEGGEVANGYYHQVVKADIRGRVYISTHQQSDFGDSTNRKIAHEAKLHLVSEPAFVDRYINALEAACKHAEKSYFQDPESDLVIDGTFVLQCLEIDKEFDPELHTVL